MKPINEETSDKKTEPEKWKTDPDLWPYRPKERMMNPYEQQLYELIRDTLTKSIVMTQVAMNQMLEIEGIPIRWHAKAYRARIDKKSLDFLICDKHTKPIIAVELDGRSHEKWDRKLADEAKDKALTAAGVKIVRIKVEELATLTREELLKRLTKK